MLTFDYAPGGLTGTIARSPAAFRRQQTDDATEFVGPLKGTWDAIRPEVLTRMRLQGRFRTGIEVARSTAATLRRDISASDTDAALYTQSLGAWDGFVAQQHMIAVKRSGGSLKRRYIHLSDWMVTALHSALGPFSGHSPHGGTATPELIAELYSRLKQEDTRELETLFRLIDAARTAGDHEGAANLLAEAEGHQTHVVPVVADIDIRDIDEDAIYNIAKRMIGAGACALQIRQQVFDDGQRGLPDNEATASDESVVAKIRAVRYAFLELGVEDGIIAIRAETLGAPEAEQISADEVKDDLGGRCRASPYSDEIIEAEDWENFMVDRNGSLPPATPVDPFHAERVNDRRVLQGITWLRNGADLLWIETQKPHVQQVADMLDGIRAAIPSAKVFFNNSSRFDWKLSFRQQVFDRWKREGKAVASYVRPSLMHKDYDGSELAIEAEECIRAFQAAVAKRAICRAA